MGSRDLQTDLIDIGRREFVAKGYGEASIRVIAKEAGVSLSAMYYYYTGKQALLAAAINASMDDFEQMVGPALASAGTDPVARLEAMVTVLVRYRAEHREESRLVQTEVRNLDEDNQQAYRNRQHAAIEPLRAAIVDGVVSGAFHTPYPEDAYRAIVGMCNAIANWYRADGPMTVTELTQRHLHLARALAGAPDINDRAGRAVIVSAPPAD